MTLLARKYILMSLSSIDNTSEDGSSVLKLIKSLGEVFEVKLLAQRNDIVLGRKLKHFSDLLSRADQRTSDVNIREDQLGDRELSRLTTGGSTDITVGAHLLGQTNILSKVFTDGQGAEKEVELASFLLQSLGASHYDTFSSEFLDELFLVLAASKGGDLAAPSLKVLDTHVTKTTDTEDGYIGSSLGESGYRSIGGNTSTEERRDSFFGKVFRDLEEEIVRLLNVRSVASPVHVIIGELVGNLVITA